MNAQLQSKTDTPTHPLSGMKLSGADIVVQVLADEGVDVVFGYSGGAILPVYDAVFRFNHDNLRADGSEPLPLIVALSVSLGITTAVPLPEISMVTDLLASLAASYRPDPEIVTACESVVPPSVMEPEPLSVTLNLLTLMLGAVTSPDPDTVRSFRSRTVSR